MQKAAKAFRELSSRSRQFPRGGGQGRAEWPYRGTEPQRRTGKRKLNIKPQRLSKTAANGPAFPPSPEGTIFMASSEEVNFSLIRYKLKTRRPESEAKIKWRKSRLSRRCPAPILPRSDTGDGTGPARSCRGAGRRRGPNVTRAGRAAGKPSGHLLPSQRVTTAREPCARSGSGEEERAEGPDGRVGTTRGHFCCHEGEDLTLRGRGWGDLSLNAALEHIPQRRLVGRGCRHCPSVTQPKAGDATEQGQLSTRRVKANRTRAGSLRGAKDSRRK